MMRTEVQANSSEIRVNLEATAPNAGDCHSVVHCSLGWFQGYHPKLRLGSKSDGLRNDRANRQTAYRCLNS